MWRPGNWEELLDNIDAGLMGYEKSRELVEAGADTMHKADVDFIRIFYPEAYFRIQASMTKEQFEAWTK